MLHIASFKAILSVYIAVYAYIAVFKGLMLFLSHLQLSQLVLLCVSMSVCLCVCCVHGFFSRIYLLGYLHLNWTIWHMNKEEEHHQPKYDDNDKSDKLTE